MLKSTKYFFLFLITIITITSKTVYAEPMFIYFNEMIKQSKTIVIGTYLGFNGKIEHESNKYYFKVDKILKGNIVSDTLVLNRAHGHVQLNPGTYCVAFINNNNAFEWVGYNKNENKIKNETILFMKGFYDYNAYLVSPATISLLQLTTYIKTETYSGSMYGNLHFFSNTTKKMEPSTIRIEVSYVYKNNEISSTININGVNLNDFIKKPTITLPIWNEILKIQYETNGYRPLQLNAKIFNSDADTNRWHLLFWLDAPKEITYNEFISYVANAAYGFPYYELELKESSNKTFSILLNDEMGKIGKLLNYNGKELSISSLSDNDPREIIFNNYPNNIIIILDSSLVNNNEFEFSTNNLVRELKINPIKANIYAEIKLERVFISSCTLYYKATKFTNNPNFKY